MVRNVGSIDKILRILVGAVLIALPFLSGFPLFSSQAMTIGAVVVGAVLVATALINFCPIYRILGIGTARAEA